MSDMVKAIAGLLAEHGRWREDGYTRCECGIAFNDDDEHRAHVASVIAAHMAAPDDRAEWEKKLIPNDEPSGLTSREVVELVNGSIDRHCAHHCKAEAAPDELTALCCPCPRHSHQCTSYCQDAR